jgi:hypothetical protein
VVTNKICTDVAERGSSIAVYMNHTVSLAIVSRRNHFLNDIIRRPP